MKTFNLLLALLAGGLSAFQAPVSPVWRFDGGSDPVLVSALHEGSLFAFRQSGTVEVVSLATGASLESFPLGAAAANAPLFDGEKAYVPCADGTLRALDLNSGKILWTAKNLPRLTTPVLFEGRLYAGSGDGRAGVWSFDPAKGSRHMFIPLWSPLYAPLFVAGNRLYAATYQGEILRIDPVKARAYHAVSTLGEFQKYAPASVNGRLLVAPSGYHYRLELIDPLNARAEALWSHSFKRPAYYSMDEFARFAFLPPENARQGLRKYLADRGEPTPSLASPEKKFYPTGLLYTSGWAIFGREAAVVLSEPGFPPEALYQIVRLDLETGKILNRVERLTEGTPAAYCIRPVITGSSVIAAVGRSTLLSVNRKTGGVEWEAQVQEGLSGDPLFYKDNLIVPLNGGSLAAFRQADAEILPAEFALAQNVPNPFNPSTVIKFQLPKASKVALKLYNVAGQELLTLIHSRKEPGFYKVTWDGRGPFKRQLPSGVYFARLSAGPYVKTIKMLLQK